MPAGSKQKPQRNLRLFCFFCGVKQLCETILFSLLIFQNNKTDTDIELTYQEPTVSSFYNKNLFFNLILVDDV